MNETAREHPVYRAEQVREFDRRAIEEQGIPGYRLMTRAATAALQALRARWPAVRRLLVVCGAGNNAGDGYVLARLAQAAGLQVRIGWLAEPGTLRGDARTAWEDAVGAGLPITGFAPDTVQDNDLIVDALLGTGLQRPLAGTWSEAVATINAAGIPVFALDIPSGLHADTGAVLGSAVRADLTLTFIALKVGLFTGSGPAYAGDVLLADLEIPATVYADVAPAAWRLNASWPARLLKARSRDSHKGDFGHVLVLGGRPGMSGAARLAGEAAARTGAGWVSVATHPEVAPMLNLGRPELMCHGVAGPEDLAPLLARADVVAVGPGLGRDAWARSLLAEIWKSSLPLVVDADALNLLAEAPQRREHWILTPHPGEAGRLLGLGSAAVQTDRPANAAELQRRFGGVIVLKGAGTLIEDGVRLRLNTTGNPGMASGGTGDLLTGIIAGLVAQRLSLSDAAVAGVVLHGLAGDAAAAAGERGMLAGDLLPELRRLVNPKP